MSVRISIITISLNAEKVIRKTIESVLCQEIPPFEYFIIDGKSKDKTVSIAKEYEKKFAKKGTRFVIVSEPDSGIYDALRKGIKMVHGDLIAFLNAGDWYEPDAFKNVSNFYNEETFDLTYGGIHYIAQDRKTVLFDKMSKLDHFLVSSRNWNCPSMFVKSELYRKYGLDETYLFADFDFYLKLRRDNVKIRVIDKVITNFVADGVSTDTDFDKAIKQAKEKYTIYRKNGFGKIYWLEAYGGYILKWLYLKAKKGKKPQDFNN